MIDLKALLKRSKVNARKDSWFKERVAFLEVTVKELLEIGEINDF